MISRNKLDFWITHKLNVCFISKHGVGKTAIVKEAFTRHFGTNWVYFSGSTMDPFIDFVGIPRETKDENGRPFLDMVQPKRIRDGVSAIFIDEYNRSKERTRNATMELIQFRSINGKPVPGLKVIWIACNPEDEGYQVEPIDPAQLDRFDVHCHLPYQLNKPYFMDKYGSGVATGAIEWWVALNPELKELVTPRRLDRVLEVFMADGELYVPDLLPSKTGPKKLVKALNSGSVVERMRQFAETSPERLRQFFEDDNNYRLCKETLRNDHVLRSKCLPYIAAEKAAAHFSSTGNGPSNIPLRENYPMFTPSRNSSNDSLQDIMNDLGNQQDGTVARTNALDRIINHVRFSRDMTPEEIDLAMKMLDPIIMRSHASTLSKKARPLSKTLNTLIHRMLANFGGSRQILEPYRRPLFKFRDALRNNKRELVDEFCVV